MLKINTFSIFGVTVVSYFIKIVVAETFYTIKFDILIAVEYYV